MFKKFLGGDYTPLEHAGISILIQILILIPVYFLIGFTLPILILTALPSIFCFYGREHAQAESRIKSSRKSKELTWDITLEAMMFWKWDYPSFMDFFLPVLACTLVSTICFIFSF